MVILIGGVSCSGKTLMAQKLLERYHIPYLSIDHLKMGLIRSGFGDFSAEQEDRELEPKLWPIVKEIVMTCIENGQHLIIEGCYIPPEELCDFPDEYRSHIISFYLVFSESYIKSSRESGIIAHSCDIEKREPIEEDGYLSVGHLCKMHRELKQRCVISGAKFFEIREDYEAGMRAAYEWIESQREKLGFDNWESSNGRISSRLEGGH